MRTRLSTLPPPQVGDLVETDFDLRHQEVRRTVIRVYYTPNSQSGISCDVDGGEVTHHLVRLDAAWIIPVAEEGRDDKG